MRILVLATLLAACVPELPRSCSWISDELSQRTGATLRPARDREFAIPPHIRLEHPLAVVILGGLVTSTLMNLFLLPALYLRFAPRSRS